MMFGRGWRGPGVALVVLALVAAGCGGDDDDDTTGDTGGSGDDVEAVAGSSTIEIEMLDFGYVVSGPLATGVQTIETTNTGNEIHMMGLGKLRDGVTIDDVVDTLTEGGDEGGGSDEGDGGDEGEGDEGDGGGDPFAELFEAEIGTPGHILFPGITQRITLTDDLDVGTYAIICFLPSEGDGAPHFAKGMIDQLEVVVEGGDTTEPEADAEYSMPDGAEPVGPTELPAGEVTLKLTNDGDISKDFGIGQVEGNDIKAFDRYFEEVFEAEGGPPVGAAGQAPGTIAGFTFEVPPGQTIYLTVTLTPGDWLLVNVNNIETDDGEDTDDYVLQLTVT